MQKVVFEKLGVDLYEGVMNNGLKVLIAPVKNAKVTRCGIYVDYGAFKHASQVGKTSIPFGVAHFLEHRLFDTPKGDATVLFEKMGASANALTSYSYTLYYFETIDKDIFTPLDLLLTMCTNFTSSEEAVENEKGIIYSEKSMYENDPLDVISHDVARNLYFNSPIKEDILGSRDNIKSIHQSTLRKVFSINYIPEKMTLIITGKVDPDEIEAYLEKVKFTQPAKVEKATPFVYTEKYDSCVKEISYRDFPIEMTRVAVGLKFPPRQLLFEEYQDELFAYYAILPDLLFGSTSKFVESLTEKGLAIQVEDYSLVEGGEDACLSATFMTEKPDELIEELKSYLSKMSKEYDQEEQEACIKAYVGSSIVRMGNARTLFQDIVSAYANHIASPSLVDRVKMMSGRRFKKFLHTIEKSPMAFAVLRKKQ